MIVKDGVSIGERIIVSKVSIATNGTPVNTKYK